MLVLQTELDLANVLQLLLGLLAVLVGNHLLKDVRFSKYVYF